MVRVNQAVNVLVEEVQVVEEVKTAQEAKATEVHLWSSTVQLGSSVSYAFRML